jgi:NAD(P)-dependent dehydrogenase (short-subunit alcohol dehydrogenase family)
VSEFNFAGGVAVVTGGASGIGQAMATRLAADGSRIAIVDIRPGAAEAAAAEIPGAIGVTADVGDPAAVRAMVARVEAELGPIGIYCSNAGVGGGSGLGDDEGWERSWRVHGLAHVYAAREVLPGMQARGSGAMVITASAAGLLMVIDSAAYTVTKHGSVAVAEWLAVNYGGNGVQVHCVCPQGVRTPMVGDAPTGSQIASVGSIIEPSEVADAMVDAIRANRFLVLPHPEVHEFETRKVSDRDRWLAGMRRLKARVARSVT